MFFSVVRGVGADCGFSISGVAELVRGKSMQFRKLLVDRFLVAVPKTTF